MEARGEDPQQDSLSRTDGSHNYEVEGANVAVAWRRFLPTETPEPSETPQTERTIVYLPGVSITPQAKSIETLCQTFADYSRNAAYAVDARVDKLSAASLVQAAEGIREFIQDRGFGEVTIVGNSKGGSIAIHLVALLQEKKPDIKLNGLVLLDSVGLYDQSGMKLLLGRNPHDMTKTQLSVARHMVKTKLSFILHPKFFKESDQLVSQDRKYLMDGLVEVLREIGRSKIGFLSRVQKELRNLIKRNPDLERIKVPVVLVQGAYDKVSDPGKIIPNQEPSSSKDSPYIVGIHDREQYLKDMVFTSSPYVRMVVPTRMGHHNVSFLRPEQVAETSLRLLERWKRQQAHTRPSETEGISA